MCCSMIKENLLQDELIRCMCSVKCIPTLVNEDPLDRKCMKFTESLLSFTLLILRFNSKKIQQ